MTRSIDEASVQLDGGRYRYLAPGGNSVTYVEYKGKVYVGDLLQSGDIHDVRPAAYNRIAADFISQEQQRIGLSQ
ncbi:hypothetical protein [Paraburkholderia sp. MM5384-R2]|uniref:hypothetical protein n=1 Tax=Paraburkholderia sp. MM5384-R2 TaxID=2723097 RepID=UPI001612A056|nr:hypothetical protein [Paraburkholderia sp. MM5384-R2]MBB5501749.1 hypothetical protein [Paraburkholderia sp. MM5384-R2]